jgi:hypothetical protein
MNQHSTHVAKDIVRRYRRYGLFGGAAVGALVGVLVSGPNFHEWATAQSLAVIAGCATGSALIGYFFLALVIGSSTGVGALDDDQEEVHGPVVRETTGIGAESGGDGD